MVIIDFNFLEQFQVHSNSEQKVQRFRIYSVHLPPTSTFCTRVVHDATINEPTLTHHNYSKSTVYPKVHSWFCTFYGSGQMHNDRYLSLSYHTQCFHCPKTPLCSIHASTHLSPATLATTVSVILPFPGCQIVGPSSFFNAVALNNILLYFYL